MRVLMVTDFYWPFLGGVEQHVRTLATSLVGNGHEVTVATLWFDNLPETEIDQGIKIVRLRSTTQRMRWLFANPGRPWAPPLPDPSATAHLMRLVRDERPQIVHGHDWLARSFVPLKRWSKARFVMSLHYYTLSCAKKQLMVNKAPCSGPGFGKCLQCAARHYGTTKGTIVTTSNWLMGALEQRTVDKFLPVSHATATGNGLAASGPRVEVVPNFITERTADQQTDVTDYLAQLPEEGFLLFVGDMRYDKGIETLLSAYTRLRNAPPLVLIGKVWPETPNPLPPNVIQLTNWPNDAVRAAWSRSICAVVPSVWPEPFGIVVIEAMMSGRPVVASRIGGIPDIVRDGETGLLVKPGDADELCAALQRVIDDVSLQERFGRAARAEALQYRSANVVPRIECIYTQLLAG